MTDELLCKPRNDFTTGDKVIEWCNTIGLKNLSNCAWCKWLWTVKSKGCNE